MKQDWTMYIYKADRRKKQGERLVSTTVWRDRTEDEMRRESAELFDLYPNKLGFRIECLPTYVTVRSLMSGAEVKIRYEDRGTGCDPSQERYWSM